MAVFSAAAATIIAGIVGTGGSLLSKYFTSKDVDAAKAESRSIYNQQRADSMRREKEQKRLNDLSFRYQKKQDRLARAERKDVREYTQRENQFQKQMGLLNSNEALKSNYLNFITRKAA